MTETPRRLRSLRRPTEYDVRKLLGTPRKLVMRRKERDNEPLAIAYLEAGRYRKDVYKFISRRIDEPDILYTFDNLSEDSLAVDVGAFEGRWSKNVSARYGCRIDAFELSPEFFGVMQQVADEHPGVHSHEYGLGGRDEIVRVSQTNMGSSVFINPVSGEDVGWIDAQIRDVAEVWSELGWDRVAVMKMNIEGGEYDLLDRLIETGLHTRVDCLFIQFHEWIPNAYARRRRIRRRLRHTHEEEWGYPWVWEKWRLKA